MYLLSCCSSVVILISLLLAVVQQTRSCTRELSSDPGGEKEKGWSDLVCGQGKRPKSMISTRIYRGRRVLPGELPFMVQVRIEVDEYDEYCGGALMSPYMIVTTASCFIYNCVRKFDEFPTKNVSVQFGHLEVDVKNYVRLPVEALKIVIHPNYCKNNVTYDDDIALIFIKSQQLTLTPTGIGSVNQICEPRFGSKYRKKDEVYVAGWGKDEWTDRSSVLLMTDLRVLDRLTCQLQLNTYEPKLKISDKILCTNSAKRKDVCTYDTGGPVFRYRPTGQMELVALISNRVKPDCSGTHPSIHTKYIPYKRWVGREVVKYSKEMSNSTMA